MSNPRQLTPVNPVNEGLVIVHIGTRHILEKLGFHIYDTRVTILGSRANMIKFANLQGYDRLSCVTYHVIESGNIVFVCVDPASLGYNPLNYDYTVDLLITDENETGNHIGVKREDSMEMIYNKIVKRIDLQHKLSDNMVIPKSESSSHQLPLSEAMTYFGMDPAKYLFLRLNGFGDHIKTLEKHYEEEMARLEEINSLRALVAELKGCNGVPKSQ